MFGAPRRKSVIVPVSGIWPLNWRALSAAALKRRRRERRASDASGPPFAAAAPSSIEIPLVSLMRAFTLATGTSSRIRKQQSHQEETMARQRLRKSS
jgi:hypothetical protein